MRAFVLVFLLMAGCLSGTAPSEQMSAGPAVGALGHSMMLGWSADADHIDASPEISWPTGDEPWSFASRMNASTKENHAQGGAHSKQFVTQAEKVEFATFVLVGFVDADLCTGIMLITDGMPNEDSFETDMRAGVRALLSRNITVMLTTMPDFAGIAEAGRTRAPANDNAVIFSLAQQCGAEPGLDERAAAMNALILRIAEEEGALHDAGAISRIAWTPDMISDVDGFHPSPAGLEVMATAAWDAYVALGR